MYATRFSVGRERNSERMLAAERLGQSLVRWCVNRKGSAFYGIVTGAAMVAAEENIRERTGRALREAGDGARKAQEEAVEVSFHGHFYASVGEVAHSGDVYRWAHAYMPSRIAGLAFIQAGIAEVSEAKCPPPSGGMPIANRYAVCEVEGYLHLICQICSTLTKKMPYQGK